jgi:hypothetical protein
VALLLLPLAHRRPRAPSRAEAGLACARRSARAGVAPLPPLVNRSYFGPSSLVRAGRAGPYRDESWASWLALRRRPLNPHGVPGHRVVPGPEHREGLLLITVISGCPAGAAMLVLLLMLLFCCCPYAAGAAAASFLLLLLSSTALLLLPLSCCCCSVVLPCCCCPAADADADALLLLPCSCNLAAEFLLQLSC